MGGLADFRAKHKELAAKAIENALDQMVFVRSLPLSALTAEAWAKARELNENLTKAHYDYQMATIAQRKSARDLTALAARDAGFTSISAMSDAGFMVYINPETGEAAIYHDNETRPLTAEDMEFKEKDQTHG